MAFQLHFTYYRKSRRPVDKLHRLGLRERFLGFACYILAPLSLLVTRLRICMAVHACSLQLVCSRQLLESCTASLLVYYYTIRAVTTYRCLPYRKHSCCIIPCKQRTFLAGKPLSLRSLTSFLTFKS